MHTEKIPDDIVAHYKQHGYCVVRNLVSDTLCDAVLKDMHAVFALQLEQAIVRSEAADIGYRATDLPGDMEALLSMNVGLYLAAAKQSAKLWAVQNLINHESSKAFVEKLGLTLPTLPTQPVLHISSERLMVPGGYFGLAAHQDWPSIQGSLDCVIAWAPLTEVGPLDFPLTVFAGSHRNGLIDGEILPDMLKVDERSIREYAPISIEASPGDMVFMSSWTVHRTKIENCRGFRLAVSSRWDNAAEATFAERAYPSAYTRTVQRELMTPNFPHPEQVRAVFD